MPITLDAPLPNCGQEPRPTKFTGVVTNPVDGRPDSTEVLIGIVDIRTPMRFKEVLVQTRSDETGSYNVSYSFLNTDRIIVQAKSGHGEWSNVRTVCGPDVQGGFAPMTVQAPSDGLVCLAENVCVPPITVAALAGLIVVGVGILAAQVRR